MPLDSLMELLYDNMKNVIIKRLMGTIQWNREFKAFAMHYGFTPYGKAKATRGLVKYGLQYEVTHRSLSIYDQLI